jgi:N-acetylmuramoyl-L-alanine amidase
VEMTRTRDVAVSLPDRVQIANRFRDAVFVSIHFNYSGTAEGLESYALAPEGVPSNAANESHVSSADVRACAGNAEDEHNIALTAAIHAMVLSRVSMFDRGVKHARFHVLRDVRMPAVLVECGFLSNTAEGQRIATAQFRQEVASAIAQGVQNYDAAVNFKPGSTNQTFAAAKKTLPPHTQSITEPLNNSYTQAVNFNPPSTSISGGN